MPRRVYRVRSGPNRLAHSAVCRLSVLSHFATRFMDLITFSSAQRQLGTGRFRGKRVADRHLAGFVALQTHPLENFAAG
jgi:hypothetical protein